METVSGPVAHVRDDWPVGWQRRHRDDVAGEPQTRPDAAPNRVEDAVTVRAVGQDDLTSQLVEMVAPVDDDPTGMPDPGLRIVDGAGHAVPPGTAGELVLDGPWAGTMCGAEGPTAEVTESHWTRHLSVYSTGDLARLGVDGSIEFLGRTDEVVSVSGQLVSLTEVREVLLGHPFVQSADVVERKDAQLGRSLAAAVVLAADALPETPDLAAVARDLLDTVRKVMGGLARPRILLFVDRFGDELTASDRRKALATLAAREMNGPLQVTWSQILAAAGPPANLGLIPAAPERPRVALLLLVGSISLLPAGNGGETPCPG